MATRQLSDCVQKKRMCSFTFYQLLVLGHGQRDIVGIPQSMQHFGINWRLHTGRNCHSGSRPTTVGTGGMSPLRLGPRMTR